MKKAEQEFHGDIEFLFDALDLHHSGSLGESEVRFLDQWDIDWEDWEVSTKHRADLGLQGKEKSCVAMRKQQTAEASDSQQKEKDGKAVPHPQTRPKKQRRPQRFAIFQKSSPKDIAPVPVQAAQEEPAESYAADLQSLRDRFK